jgi:Tol biopolymer transport system component
VGKFGRRRRTTACRSERTGKAELYLVNVDGSGLVRLTRNRAADDDPIWSPNGTEIFFVRGRSGKSATTGGTTLRLWLSTGGRSLSSASVSAVDRSMC